MKDEGHDNQRGGDRVGGSRDRPGRHRTHRHCGSGGNGFWNRAHSSRSSGSFQAHGTKGNLVRVSGKVKGGIWPFAALHTNTMSARGVFQA